MTDRRRTGPARPGAVQPTVGVAGLGYMGLATALAFARRGTTVVGFDAQARVRASLRAARSPIREAGLDELLREEVAARRFSVSESWDELVRAASIIFLCLPTPPGPSGEIDLAPLRRGLRELGEALRGPSGRRLVVVKSTVVPGTTEGIVGPELAVWSKRSPEALGIAANPEFLAEGTMVKDALFPSRIVLGVSTPSDERRLRKLYASFPSPVVVLTPTGAEIAKYASNAFLALKVTYANEISRLCEATATDVGDVMTAVGRDPRIGPSFLSAGPGFGGSCFEKDLRALLVRSRRAGVDLRLLRAILLANEDQTRHAIELVERALGSFSRREVALLGLAFKAGTDDVRESRAIPILRALLKGGARVRLHDPLALPPFRELVDRLLPRHRGRISFCSTVEEALTGADAAVLHSDAPEYVAWPAAWSARMRHPTLVDLRRAIPRKIRTRGDLRWFGLGSASVPPRATAGGVGPRRARARGQDAGRTGTRARGRP